MKPFFLLLFLMLYKICCFGQIIRKDLSNVHQYKALIDSSTYDNWPTTQAEYLSNNGKYISYFVGNQNVGWRTLELQSNDGKWKRKFCDIENVMFTLDSKKAILSASDRIYIVKLGVEITDTLTDVVSFKLSQSGNGEWIAYRQGTKEGKLIVRNLENNKSSVFLSVNNYYFNRNTLILLREGETGTVNTQHLEWVNLSDNKIYNLWNGSGLKNLIFSSDGNKLAFVTNDKSDLINKNGIWYCELGARKAYCILPDLKAINDSNLELSRIQYFSRDNSQIFVTLKEKSHPSKNIDIDNSLPEVWSFNDKMLQSQQKKEIDQKPDGYKAVVNILTGNIFRIEEDDEFSLFSYGPPQKDYIVVFHRDSDVGAGEVTWNAANNIVAYLVSTKTGKRTPLNSIGNDFYPGMSKNEKYFIYADKGNENFFTYEIASGIITNITKNINTSWGREFSNPVVDWINNDSAVVMYDRNDVWLLDPKGIFSPVNLTNGYGKRNNIQLFITNYNDAPLSFTKKKKVFLTAFNPNTKENGFYSFTFGQSIDPVLLTMGSVIYDIPGNSSTPDGVNFTPKKAKNANSYIVRRMSTTEYPNLYYTTNFKTFIPITDFQPHKNYNWYSTELHKWKSLDGRFLQGILYKPENFDSTKKYPVIFNYYESKSDGLNAFLLPTSLNNGCVINIPYYVSNGYLVFCPDIEYTIGDPMQGTYNAVVSAAEYLRELPFIDARKMGIQGCSWGGIQTNYLITQTNLFAAACSGSGIADWISGFNSLFGNGSSSQGMYEDGQFRIGGNLWDSLHSYVKSSPILQVDKISTPVLLMHTKDDGVCPFTNAIEFFTALRRLGKKSWMLVYEGNHGVFGNEGKDFSIRMAQFFDHYLKDIPAPFWMTRGIPAKLKGMDTGLNLDYTIKTPTSKLINDTINTVTSSQKTGPL